MTHFPSRTVASLAMTISLLPMPASANWPQWRGPHGNGTADAADLPSEWSPGKNIAWKTELPSWSGSTPVIWGDRVFAISPSKPEPPAAAEASPSPESANPRRGRGRAPANTGGPGGNDLFLFCLARADGKILWQQKFDAGNRMGMKHNSTSPSPVTDGQRVYVTSGNGVLAAFDFAGKKVWGLDLAEKYGKIGTGHGYGSSPIVHEGKLIVEVIHGRTTDAPSYLLALDPATGQELWRHERASDAREESKDAYTTPALLSHEGKSQIVILGANYVTGHDPKDGRELWRGGGLNPRDATNYRIVPSPVVADGMIYAATRVQPLLAFRAGGTGDISTSHLAWRYEQRDAPDVPTPTSDGKYFYMPADDGRISCLDAKTGAVLWSENTGVGRLTGSPLLADGKLYVVGETGETAVMEAGPQYKPLAKNPLDGQYTLSSPAAVGKELFIRSGSFLYCIRKSP